MSAYERRRSVLDLLRKQPGLRVPEIAENLRVSEGTVRHDLTALESDGSIIRFHGGAVLRERAEFHNTSFTVRHQEHTAEKILIARYAARLISDGDSILLDASSTAYYLALAIQSRNRLRVVTNGLDVARLLAQNPSNTVILIGGVVNSDGSSVTGLFSEGIIQELHIQKAFVSCSGFSLERGMTEVHLDEARLKRKAIESAAEVIALVDASKIGKEDLTPFARLNQVTHLFTDGGLNSEWMERLKQAGLSYTKCEDETVLPIQ